MCEFERKSVLQAHDTFSPKADLNEVDAFIREQGKRFGVPGELVISYPGNGGRTSVVFKGKPVVHRGEVEPLP